MHSEHGLVQIYTGNGKGKTTAAWGLALRAVGRDLRVAVIQFMKPLVSGERAAADRLHPNLQVFGESRPYDVCADQTESNTCREDSRANFETARTLMLSGEYDVVIMDEIHLVLHYGYVTRDEMKELLSERSSMIELVLTGRYAPEWLLEEADLVTEMMEVKHPAARGVKARKGMEY